jgi:uncharacterized protein YycO
MKKIIFATIIIVFLFLLWRLYLHKKIVAVKGDDNYKSKVAEKTMDTPYRDGDVIFHTSKSSQSSAIQLVTKSKYSHCGIIFLRGGTYFVFEAVNPVKLTPLNNWIQRGVGAHFVVKRLRNFKELLTSEIMEAMKKQGDMFLGKDYDEKFCWTDDEIYCSELIWKVYKRGAGVELGKLQQLGDFDLSDPSVKKLMKARKMDKLPLSETVISPAAIFESELLMTIDEK